MGIDAVALVKVAPALARERLGMSADEKPEPPLELWQGANGVPLLVRPLEDALLVFTHVRMREDPDAISLTVRRSLGELLDAHDDPRGILLFPEVAAPHATGYDAVVAEIGEAGEWTAVVSAGHLPERLGNAPAGSFEALMGGMMAGMGSDPGELAGALFGGDPAKMQQLMERAEQALEAMGGPAALEQAMQAMMAQAGEEGLDPATFPRLPALDAAELQRALDDPKAREALRASLGLDSEDDEPEK